MSQSTLENFGAYRKSLELFDLVVIDKKTLSRKYDCLRLISQQLASADSIASNIEEGYGRISRAEYRRFLDFARGSARETRGRYLRMKRWLSSQIITDRLRLVDEIISIITATINTLSGGARN